MAHNETFPWYAKDSDDSPLEQGCILRDFPVIIPNVEAGDKQKIVAEERTTDVIILTQSCDLAAKKAPIVMVCLVWSLAAFADANDYYKSDKGKEALRRGYVASAHLLNQCNLAEFSGEYLVVDFRKHVAVPFEYLVERIKEAKHRIRLLPPYREHLSQAFARFFMRVGLPTDIARFAKSAGEDVPE